MSKEIAPLTDAEHSLLKVIFDAGIKNLGSKCVNLDLLNLKFKINNPVQKSD